MSKEHGFPTKIDLALIGILAVSSCNTLTSPEKPPEIAPTPTSIVRDIPTIGPAVMALRVPEKDRGIHH